MANEKKYTTIEVAVEFGATAELEVDFNDVNVVQKIKPTGIYFENQKVKHIPTEMIDISNMTSLALMFNACQKLQSIDVKDWDTTNITSLYATFSFWSSVIKRLDIGHFKTSKVQSMQWLFRASAGLQWVDLSSWDAGAVRSFNSIFGSVGGGNDTCYSLRTIIGDHTLEEVESGAIVALRDAGKSIYSDQALYIGPPVMRYSSILAFTKGMYDRTEMTAVALTLSKTAFNNMRNDDDTIPDAYTIAERQTKIRTVCAAKNYTLTLS